MKSIRTLLNSLIFAGLALGIAGSACASEAPAPQLPQSKFLSLNIDPARLAAMSQSAAVSQAPAIKPNAYTLSALGKGFRSLGNGIQSIANGVLYTVNGLWYATTHPKLTLPTIAIPTIAYLYMCRSNGRNWTPEIQAAEVETLQFDATSYSVDTPRSQYRYWNLRTGSAQEMVSNPQRTYANLRRDFPINVDKQQFVDQTIRKIDVEKTILKQIFAKLDRIFAQSNLLPRFKSYHPVFDNPVLAIINNYLKEQNCAHFYYLSSAQFDYLNRKIDRNASFSLFSLFNTKPWKTFNWHRLYAVPYEADAIEQYWKVYQMVAHLDALQFCLNQALTDSTLV